MKRFIFFVLSFSLFTQIHASKLYIPMDDDNQKDHLKAYGIAYASLQLGIPVDWLLNYDGGAFAMDNVTQLAQLCKNRGVTYQTLDENAYLNIVKSVEAPDYNGSVIKLEKAPRIAVYTPLSKLPWDDAVTMALVYAEIPYDKVYDDELLNDKLANYDWLHLHHEDFTGQFGKFWSSYRNADWYIADQKSQEAMAYKHGFKKVSALKLAVSNKIKNFVGAGGYLFAMCSATDSWDIALAAEGLDICEAPFDGDPADPTAQSKLNFDNGMAFQDYTLITNPGIYEYANIDNTLFRGNVSPLSDYFTLFSFSAKFDPVPTMLTQNHTTTIKGFMGQTTAFRKETIKSNIIILGESSGLNEARYLHGSYGKGTFTFYGGHDPEDYQHAIGDPPTDLSLHPNSAGYRLILNNVLFPAAKKKPRKT